MSDLLGLNTESWNPSTDFPADITVDGFDNDGAELVTSGLLLEKYFPAAEGAISRATKFESRPESKSYQQNSPFYFSGKESKGLPNFFKSTDTVLNPKPLHRFVRSLLSGWPLGLFTFE